MSDKTSTASRRVRDVYDEEAVAAYLLEHPDFVARRPEVLAAVEASACADGTASLLEKQVAVLREQKDAADLTLTKLVETARANENLRVCLHKIALELLRDAVPGHTRLNTARKVSCACRGVLNKRIPDICVTLHWFQGFLAHADEVVPDDLVVTDEKDQRIAGFVNALFTMEEPSCGPFSEPERVVLFGSFAASTQSAVVTALAEPGTGGRMGMLTLASSDPARFAVGKGTMFLVQLVQLIECAFTASRG